MLGIRDSLEALTAALARIDFRCDPRAAISATVSSASLHFSDLETHVRFIPGRYTRNLVFRNADFELLILCWSDESGSPVHDHGDQHCTMRLIDGSLTIDDYAIMSGGRRQGYAHIAPTGSSLLRRGELDVRSSKRDLHRVTATHGPAISLHVYAKPIDRFMIFSPHNRSCRTVMSRYDSQPASNLERTAG